MYFTTSIAIAAGVCLAYGALYLFVGLRRVADRRRHLLFGFFALAYAGAVLLARRAFLSTSPEHALPPIRASLVFTVVGFALLAWYVAEFTGVRPRRFLWTVTGGLASIGLAAVAFPDLLGSRVESAVQTLPWNETILAWDLSGSPLFVALLAAQAATIGYVIAADVILLRRGHRSESLGLLVGLAWFAATIIQEQVVQLAGLDFVVLSDFGFAGFVVAMALEEGRRGIEVEQSLLAYKAQLETEIRARTIDLETAQAELLAQERDRAVTEERNRIARELHDAVTQLLFSINLIAGSLPALVRRDPETAERTVGELQRLTRGALAEMRTLLRELRPHTIVNTELPTLVGQLTDGLGARHDIPVDLTLELAASLPPAVHLAVYRIAQEALNNVAKHANASRLEVALTGDDHHVHLSVADDGSGFDPSDVSGHHMGLDIMQERAMDIGGEVVVVSNPNAGTTVELSWEANSHV